MMMMKKRIWIAVGASASLIAAAGMAPAVGRAGGPLLRELWQRLEPWHLLLAAAIFGLAGGAPLLASRWPSWLEQTRHGRRARARTPEQRLARIARRKGLSRDAVRILEWRDKERPARRRRAGAGPQGSSFRPARSSAAPRPAASAHRQERSTWAQVA